MRDEIMKTLVRGGTVVTEDGTFRGDVLIEDGKILLRPDED